MNKIIIKLCYYNEHWNVYIYTHDGYRSWNDHTQQTKREDESYYHKGEYRLRRHPHADVPIYSFGFFSDNPKQRPEHGGEWSSNSTTINKIFDVEVIKVGIDQCAAAVPVKWIKEQLGDKVTWAAHPIYGHVITHVKGVENKCDAWTTINREVIV